MYARYYWHCLNGNKTYISGIVTILGSVFTVLSQVLQHQPPDLNSAFQLIMTAILGMSIRHGLQTGAQPGFAPCPDDVPPPGSVS